MRLYSKFYGTSVQNHTHKLTISEDVFILDHANALLTLIVYHEVPILQKIIKKTLDELFNAIFSAFAYKRV